MLIVLRSIFGQIKVYSYSIVTASGKNNTIHQRLRLIEREGVVVADDV
jgi:hypothetical protein